MPPEFSEFSDFSELENELNKWGQSCQKINFVNAVKFIRIDLKAGKQAGLISITDSETQQSVSPSFVELSADLRS